MFTRHLIRPVVASALLFAMVACSGSPTSTSSLVPSGTGIAPQAAGGGITKPDNFPILSSCGITIKVLILDIVNCQFREKGYGGIFKLLNLSKKGIFLLSPLRGTEKTVFTVLGAVLGSGDFLVKDTRGHILRIKVKVVL